MDNSNPVLEKIKKLVNESGTKAAAARTLDITPAYLGEILAGTRPISDNLARKLGYLRAPTEWVPIRPDTGLAVSADGKIHGDQIGEGLRKHDERVAIARTRSVQSKQAS